MKVKVYTVLVGREDSDLFGGMSVNPATLRNIATITGGEFFRATDYDTFDRGFQTVRKKLDTTKRERKRAHPRQAAVRAVRGCSRRCCSRSSCCSRTRGCGGCRDAS